ncbi:protein arginine N-methyltransferase 5 [Metschnikowia aff. pulcherrima]|uniref:Protein arginine N-methyltransferase 5 n=1 Tax=Metschnikowia aff. pulcherrima TaxID=2163413 RepID=A0A4P6XPW8_9ASCO|nr:protein arginine N-methyltransferase 5 [Metschnikowia aff. pulcherrima]
MPFGVVIDGFEPVDLKADFYVPRLRPTQFNDISTIQSSHVILEFPRCLEETIQARLSQLDVPSNVTVLVSVSECTTVTGLYSVLLSLPYKTGLIVPIIDDLSHYRELRDNSENLRNGPQYVLELRSPVSFLTLRRYKCLRYMAIYAESKDHMDKISLYEMASELARKSSRPALLISTGLRAAQPYLFWRSLSEPKIEPYSDMLIDPLQPLSVDMNLDVYETFERDRTKYEQYELAIELAISDLGHMHNRLHILVIGPGRGPLLEMVMKHARADDKVVAIEKNSKCHPVLLNICNRWPQNVELIAGDVRALDRSVLGTFDLVVSELLGSFGCNEAAPEILDVFREFSPVIIPQEFRSFAQPIYTNLNIDLASSRPYLIKLNSFYPVGEIAEVFEFLYPGKNNLNRQKGVHFMSGSGETANAIYGYFEAVLYGPYKIGILPEQSSLEYCTSWFPVLFHIHKTDLPMLVIFQRTSTCALSYTWTVNGQSLGEDYAVDLVCDN